MYQEQMLERANILAEALPYIHKLSKKTVVIKYGGNAMNSEEVTRTILQDVAILKIVGINPILVHGGGPDINRMLQRLGIPSQFHNGLRVTDRNTMDVVQMVLCGKLNKDITSKLTSLGVSAIGLCGKDAKLLGVTKKMPEGGVDLGYVGEITSVNARLLEILISDEFIPVIASVGTDAEGNSYNVNADTAASEIAAAMHAEKLIFLTDIDGIRRDEKDPASLIPAVTVDEINEMIANGTISGGMIPKVRACTRAVEKGIRRTHIVNGCISHPILLEIFTDSGIGTMVTK